MKKYISALIVTLLSIIFCCGMTVSAETKSSHYTKPDNVQVLAAYDRVVLRWNGPQTDDTYWNIGKGKHKGGYRLYRYDEKSGKFKAVKDHDFERFDDMIYEPVEKLKGNTTYYFKIGTYEIKNGKKTIIAKSGKITAKTSAKPAGELPNLGFKGDYITMGCFGAFAEDLKTESEVKKFFTSHEKAMKKQGYKLEYWYDTEDKYSEDSVTYGKFFHVYYNDNYLGYVGECYSVYDEPDGIRIDFPVFAFNEQ